MLDQLVGMYAARYTPYGVASPGGEVIVAPG